MAKEPNFQFSEAVKEGAYVASYFKKTVKILETLKPNEVVLMQWFQRGENTTLCGVKQVLALLKFACPNYHQLKIWSLEEGSLVQPLEPVLKIEGHYQDFGWLEGMIDGILARNSSIATNARLLVGAAQGKPIIDMEDRADLYLNQEVDGYAAYIGGIRHFVSEAALTYIQDDSVGPPMGTMPHALIQAFNGDTLEATKAFYEFFPKTNLVSLVDYDNDAVNEALRVANYFGKKLWGIRLDTAGNLIDKTLINNHKAYPATANLHGVNEYLIREVRQALDKAGHNHVKIIVSSSFNAKKIADFEAKKVPVDIYGVGSALAEVNIGFTGDSVLLNGKNQAKFGRQNQPTKRLKKIQ
ncbi:nicotinate phosphoribosyltransferase [Entomoplasma freundtii]|uniref:nicotinate phosphoribosyltransferase n=1 Tax=Entomoplasma freundtii TaxID=74700 RepID=A0A2K8NUY5_9MOLU|nr:nicotinate phosphoribosyltransferase [Entomoplasma freundtii]ATZ16443.1 nicotinate phosphoribosyltransferase [Entomoplasma freundtii]TDY55973.1 nicotinate phosphoribosyltransferase [Entomoplasma freundtii]